MFEYLYKGIATYTGDEGQKLDVNCMVRAFQSLLPGENTYEVIPGYNVSHNINYCILLV